MLRDRDEAEEAVQEAFVRGWLARDRCRTPAAPLAWMLQITRHEALRVIDGRRRHERRARREREHTPSEPGTASEVDSALSEIAVRQLLRGLPPDDRRLVYLHYIEEVPQRELAKRLQMPVGTIKVRLHRTRKRLQDLVEA